MYDKALGTCWGILAISMSGLFQIHPTCSRCDALVWITFNYHSSPITGTSFCICIPGEKGDVGKCVELCVGLWM